MESFLWPLFFLQHDQHQHQQSKNKHKHKPSKKNSDKFQLSKAASLLMQLTNIRTSSNAIAKGSMNGPLSFMVNANVGDSDDTADNDIDNDIDNDNAAAAGAFRLLLTTLLSGTGAGTGTGDKDSDSDLVGIVSFLTTVYNNMTREMYPIVRSALLDLVGIGLWNDTGITGSSEDNDEDEDENGGICILVGMSKRYRDLLLRKAGGKVVKEWQQWRTSNNNDNDDKSNSNLHRFIPRVMARILTMIDGNSDSDDSDDNDADTDMSMELVHVTLQLCIDLLSNASTRYYLRPYLLSIHLSTKCKLSKHYHSHSHRGGKSGNRRGSGWRSKGTRSSTNLFQQLTQILQQLESFAVDDTVAVSSASAIVSAVGADSNSNSSSDVNANASAEAALSHAHMASTYHDRAHILQKLCHRHHPEVMSEIIYAGVGMICNSGGSGGTSGSGSGSGSGSNSGDGGFLRRNLDRVVDVNVLIDLCHRLRLADKSLFAFDNETMDNNMDDNDEGQKQYEIKKIRKLTTELLIYHHTLHPSESSTLRHLSLYPDEKLLWNPHLVPAGRSNETGTLALPKMSMSFLTYSDYLLRCFQLLRLESAYEIRSDIVDVIKRMRPALRHGYVDMDDADEMDNVNDIDRTGKGGMHDSSQWWSKRRSLTEFHGWSRMGLQLTHHDNNGNANDNNNNNHMSDVSPVRLLKVSPPKLGESVPSHVTAEITIDLKHCGERIREEWDSIGEFDNLFLVGVDASVMEGGVAPSIGGNGDDDDDDDNDEIVRRVADDEDMTFPRRFGITAVRGCMVLEVRDGDGNVLSDPTYMHNNDNDDENGNNNNKKRQQHKHLKGKGGRKGKGKGKGVDNNRFKRYLRVALDPAQYAADATGSASGSPFGTKVYQALNVIIRRHGKENNFKAVLETVRGLMQGAGSIHRTVPRWLQPVLLGYGDPTSASFSSKPMIEFAEKTAGVNSPDAALDYGDTFVSEEHLRASFEGSEVIVDGGANVNLHENENATSNRSKYRIQMEATADDDNGNSANSVVKATSYPFPSATAGNPIRFTPVQVKAIRSGLSPGLTMIVGPPGTGKTDVAVQIIANLYHSFPTQRTVLITHSNAALNDLFEKVMARGDIDERYMLRLGSGERDLETDAQFDFTKTGRVNHILARRATLLEQVQQMSESLGISGASERGSDGSPSYTCETAEYFNLHHIQKRIHLFNSKVKDIVGTSSTGTDNAENIGDHFPFGKYFNLSPSDVSSMTLQDVTQKLGIIEECFDELAEYRPLELLRSQRQRTDYLLTKQVRIVAMTCTHAAIARSHLVELGFQYDNIVMEEAAQMLDVESFVPLLLQGGSTDTNSRLKRVCLIGDHHQLPPVIKNMTFSKYSNLDQSLFTRLIRLGVPTIDLNRQGRARAEIAKLYNWRYKGLGDLGHVSTEGKFLTANPGLCHTYQMINVEDYEGRGEYAPTPYYYQNTGEAEYAVALFQYMVLMGYLPEKISILTTYNGQKGLIDDIISQRCGEGSPMSGVRPGAVSTVDKYQGQQNDYIILSLVRTKTVGHVRDIRRLIVAVSRARLGLYIMGRQSLFRDCHELRPVMDQLSKRPSALELVIGEQYPTKRSATGAISEDKKFVASDISVLGKIVHDLQNQLHK